MVKEKNLKGLHGWLILVALSVIGSLILLLLKVYENIQASADGSIDLLTNPSSAYYVPGFNLVDKFEIVGFIIFAIASIYLLYLFFKKSKKFPNYYIFYIVALVIWACIDYALFASLSSPKKEIQDVKNTSTKALERTIIRNSSLAAIWGLYMKKSKRVKATFVE